MASGPDVKSLLLEVDASVELLRRNLNRGEQAVGAFESDTRQRLDRIDRRFEQLGTGLNGLPRSIARTRAEIATIGATTSRVEAQVRASSTAMRTALLASTSAIASVLTADKIKDYADGYTRFTNQLKVAGLEGQALGKTQNDLYAIAQRYGVQLESVGTLYGRLSQGAKELGANQSQLLRFTNGVGAALKVQGGDAAASAGALLQLTQALGGTYVRAEEFNSVNEGARPILQAVANGIERTGGSVFKLRNEVIAGTLTSKEFFEGFLKGSAQLERQAAQANFTIGASFVVLNNALGKYIGETDASLSATARVAGGIEALANNLDIVIPALTTIGAIYATNRVLSSQFIASVVAGAATSQTASASAGASARIFAQQITAGNVAMIGTVGAAAARAEAIAAAAAVEVAEIEATITARRAEQTVLGEQIAQERALAAERKAQAVNFAAQNASGGNRTTLLAAQRKAENDATFATQRLTAARERLVVVDGELAAAETALAGAQTRATETATVATAATARLTLASRAGEAASKLLAGGLTLIGGSVAGGAAVLAIGAVVGALLAFNAQAATAEQQNAATAESMHHAAEAGRRLNQDLAVLATTGQAAASGIQRAGGAAAASTGQMLTFAGAVGEAAEKLRQLARERRRSQVMEFTTQSVDAEHRANEAQARIDKRRGNIAAGNGGSAMGIGGGGLSDAQRRANEDDARLVTFYRSLQGSASRAAQTAANIPLENRIRESDRVGGRDVDGNIARIRRDLTIATQAKNKGQVADLKAQLFEEQQYKKYRGKDGKGLSAEAASQAASADAARFRSAQGQGRAVDNAKAGARAQSKADREAAAAARKEVAQVRDAASDERAYSAAERKANDDIATARADLTQSAVERAKIEKDRIESERQNRRNEIEQQAKQGGLGTGDVANTRKLELQRLNDERAALETQVVDAREKQRVADEALSIAQAGRQNEADLLQRQADMVVTLRERRTIEQRLLDLQYQEERAKLEGVIASRDTTEAEKKIAQARLAMLGQLQAADQQDLNRKNASPLDRYKDDLRRTVGDMDTAMSSVKANGLQSVEDGLTSIVTGAQSARQAFKQMAASIIADLARIAIRKAIVAAIGGGFADGGSLSRIPGRADGGSLGGLISGPGTGRSDSILALLKGPGGGAVRLSNKEFIMNERAVNYYGPNTMAALNARRVPRFADGGPLRGAGAPSLRPATLPSLRGFAGRGGGRTEVAATVKVEASPLLLASVQQTTMQTVAGAAEPIMAGAENRTVRRLNRSDLPGAPL